jgi:hypothetical protein
MPPPIETISRVADRARGNLNDQGAQLWSDNLLLPHISNAYEWAYSKMAVYEPTAVRKTVGQPYTDATDDIIVPANTTNITTLLPVDMWLPEKLEYRLSTSEEWVPMDRRTALPSQITATVDIPTTWVWQNRQLFMNPAASDARIRLTYISLFPHIDDTGADVANRLLLDDVVAALAFYAAGSAYASRGQTEQAKAMMGSENENEFPGALGMMDLAIRVLVQNQQKIPRRGAPYSSGPQWNQFGGQNFPTQ